MPDDEYPAWLQDITGSNRVMGPRVTSPLVTYNHWCVAAAMQTKGGLTVEYLHSLPIPTALDIIYATFEVLTEVNNQTRRAVEEATKKR